MVKSQKISKVVSSFAAIALVSRLILVGLPIKPVSAALVPELLQTVESAVSEDDIEPTTLQHILLDVCQERGYGEDCAKTLLGMAWKETNFKGKAIGDGGKARGWFQIWYKMHKISLACAEDLRCSANWTIDYLEQNGYPKYKNYAIQCHNGCNINNGYMASVKRHGARLWNQEASFQIALAK